MKSKLISASIAIVTVTSLMSPAANAITNGTNIADNPNPTIAAQAENAARISMGFSSCSGTILNQDWLLTAAHCVPSLNLDNATNHISYGSENGDKTTYAEYAIAFPINDTALLKLGSPAQVSQNIEISDIEPLAGEEMNVRGWDGRMGLNRKPQESKLSYVNDSFSIDWDDSDTFVKDGGMNYSYL